MGEVSAFPGSLGGLLQGEYQLLLKEAASAPLRQRAQILLSAIDSSLRLQALGIHADPALADAIEGEFVLLLQSLRSDKQTPEGTCGLTVTDRIAIASAATAFLSKRRKLKRHDVKSGIDLLQSQFRDARRTGRRRGSS